MKDDIRSALDGHLNDLRDQSYPEKPEQHFFQKVEFVRGVIHGLRISASLTAKEYFQALAVTTQISDEFKRLKAA